MKVYPAQQIAEDLRETFADRPVEKIKDLDFDWPQQVRLVGHSLAVGYTSDKWQEKDSRGRRQVYPYKHLAESENKIFIKRGWLKPTGFKAMGPLIDLRKIPLPDSFAFLGLFELVDIHLFNAGSNARPRFDPNDELIVEVDQGAAKVGGSMLLWSELYDGVPDEPFLFVYTLRGGVQCIITGDELDIKKDGIVG